MFLKCFVIVVFVFFAEIILSIISKVKKWKDVTPFRIMFGACFVSVFVLMIPLIDALYPATGPQSGISWWTRAVLSFHNTLQVFTVDVGAGDIIAAIKETIASPEVLKDIHNSDFVTAIYNWTQEIGKNGVFSGFSFYRLAMSILIGICPVLTLSFILSFMQNASAWIRLRFSFMRERYIFSELNNKSLALAQSIRSEDKRASIIFTDVFRKNEEASYELLEEAKKIKAVCLKRDIVTMNAKPHSSEKKVYLFTIGEDETENLEQAVKLIDYYRETPNVLLYVFSTRTDGELILTKTDKGCVEVRRVNEVRSLIYRLLKEQGKEKLFDNARRDKYGVKTISAVIVGLGRHGTEMLKALTWFCQMDGYRIVINAFDADKNAESKFEAKAPDLLSPDYNKVSAEGEAEYDITIYSGIDVYTKDFYEKIKEIQNVTYAFVSLGSDEENIRTAAELRMIFERTGDKEGTPAIQTVVYNTNIKESLNSETVFNNEKPVKGAFNHKGQPYNIDFVGDLKSSYSRSTIFNTEMENSAKRRHRKSYIPQTWQYEYNYNSSIASGIHKELQDTIIGDNPMKKAETEHRRWNAYMRGEGYIFSGSTDKESRNDLAKKHPDLIAYGKLPPEEQLKDVDIVG